MADIAAAATKPQPLSHTPKQISIDFDAMDPIAWNMEPSAEEVEDLALLNIVELEQDEVARGVDNSEKQGNETSYLRKRCREDDEDNDEDDEEEDSVNDSEERMKPPEGAQRKHQLKILPSVSQDTQEYHLYDVEETDTPVKDEEELTIITVERAPRLSSGRRKKKLRRCSSTKSLPKRPLGAYGIFYHQERQKIVESLTGGTLSEDDIQRRVGKLWRALPQDIMKKFEHLAEQEKARYHDEMEANTSNRIKISSGPSATTTNGIHSGKGDPKRDEEEEEEEEEEEIGYFPYDLPPPPPGITVIPARGSGSDAKPAVQGMNVATPTPSSPVQPPPPVSPGGVWGSYLCPPPPPSLSHPGSYASPVPSSTVSGPHVVQASPYPPPPRRVEYFPSPSPRSWVATTATTSPSPYHHRQQQRQQQQLPPPPPSLARNSPDFAHAARPAATYHLRPLPPPPPPHRPTPTRLPNFSIPPGMELALPDGLGGERKYRVTYKCFKMRADDVQGFLDSMAATPPHPPPPQLSSPPLLLRQQQRDLPAVPLPPPHHHPQQQLPIPLPSPSSQPPHHYYHLSTHNPVTVTTTHHLPPPRPRQVPYHPGQVW